MKNKKHRYEIYKPIIIEVRTIISATSKEEALKLSKERHISICRHGTEDHDAEEEFVIIGDVIGPEGCEDDFDAYINDIN